MSTRPTYPAAWSFPLVSESVKRCFRLGAFLALAALINCGGGGGGGGSDAKLTLSPATATVGIFGELGFTAALSDGSRPNLVWSLGRPAMGGVSPSGLFLAGDIPGQVVLTARTADGATSANATIDIPAPSAGEGLHLFSGVIPGPGLADGPGPAAILSHPHSVTCLPSGDIAFTDSWTHSVRRVAPDGQIITIAGRSGSMAWYADGFGGGARFQAPTGIASDPAGNLYVIDPGNLRIRKILPTGQVTTLAGSGISQMIDGSGSAAGLKWPKQIAWGGTGLLCFTDSDAIRTVTVNGTVSTLVHGLSGPQGLCVASNGDIIFIDAAPGGSNWDLKTLSPNGTVKTLSWAGPGGKPYLSYAFGVAQAGDGSLYLADYSHVYRRAPDGSASLFAGGPGSGIGSIEGIFVDQQGNLLLADSESHTVHKVTSAGADSIVAGCSTWSQAVDGPALQARFGSYAWLSGWGIGQMAPGPGNTLYVLDPGNHSIRKVDATGTVSTLAVLGNPIYPTETPMALAVDADGNAYVSTWANQVWLVTANGTASVFAGAGASVQQQDGPRLEACFLEARGLALLNGILYVGDRNCIRTISLNTGLVSTLAGSFGYGAGLPADGTGAAASFRSPSSMTIGPDGNIYFVDLELIRKVTPSGTVTTIAGANGGTGFQDGPVSQAKFSQPSQLAFDPRGNLLIVDPFNFLVRQLDAAGNVSSVFGNRNFGDEVVLSAYPGGIGLQCSGIAVTGDGTVFLSVRNGILKAGRPH